MTTLPTREVWLHNLISAVSPWFDEPVPDVRVSVGFPSRSALSRSTRRIGECWGPALTADGRPQIFISPLLGMDRVGDVLVHELVHAVVGVEHGHKAPFRRMAVNLGLTGKMTATVAGEALTARLNDVYAELGEYPHSPLGATGKDKKQTTRMIKAMCAEDDYVVRLSRTTLDKGAPICPICKQSMGEC